MERTWRGAIVAGMLVFAGAGLAEEAGADAAPPAARNRGAEQPEVASDVPGDWMVSGGIVHAVGANSAEGALASVAWQGSDVKDNVRLRFAAEGGVHGATATFALVWGARSGPIRPYVLFESGGSIGSDGNARGLVGIGAGTEVPLGPVRLFVEAHARGVAREDAEVTLDTGGQYLALCGLAWKG